MTNIDLREGSIVVNHLYISIESAFKDNERNVVVQYYPADTDEAFLFRDYKQNYNWDSDFAKKFTKQRVTIVKKKGDWGILIKVTDKIKSKKV